MSNPQYPPPDSGGFPPPDGWPGSYNPAGGFPPPPPANGFPPPENYSPPGGYPSQGGYSPPGWYPPPGTYNPSGGFPPPGGYSPPPGSYMPPETYQSPGGYQPPSMYGSYQQPLYSLPPNLIAGLPVAGFGDRFVALVLDGILAGIAWSIVSSILHISGGFWGGAIFYAAYAVLTSLYLEGATPGKIALGLKVIDERGNLPEPGSLILRYSLAYWASWFIAGIGFLLAATDIRKQALHDKIAKTYVVKKPRAGYMPPPPYRR